MSKVWLIEVQYVKSLRWVPVIGGPVFETKGETVKQHVRWQLENPRATYRAAQYKRVKP